MLPSLKEAGDLRGKRVILRASLNVPIKDGAVANAFRLKRALLTIKFLKDAGAKTVIIAHIGREKTDSLKPVYEAINNYLDIKWGREEADILEDGEVVLLENLRQDEREKANDTSLAEELAALGDVYVNDAFAASHRSHASLVGIPKLLPSYFGFNFIHEYEELTKAMSPREPSLFILGGAKFETKLPLVEKYAEKYTQVFVGGALANDVFKARGYEVGKSLVSDVDLRESPILDRSNILHPVDVRVKTAEGQRESPPQEVKAGENILDAGPKTIAELNNYVKEAKTILWNGPLGDYEMGFSESTKDLAQAIAAAPGYSVVGGGDTIASIEELNLEEKFGFLSTAGGAMLTFLETGTLPALHAVLNKTNQQ